MVEVVGGARGLLDKGSSESEPRHNHTTQLHIHSDYTRALSEQHPNSQGSYLRDCTFYESNVVDVPRRTD